MEEGNDVSIARPIELLELAGNPGELSPVVSDVGINRHGENTSVANCVCEVPVQSPGGAFCWNQFRHRRRGVAETGGTAGRQGRGLMGGRGIDMPPSSAG